MNRYCFLVVCLGFSATAVAQVPVVQEPEASHAAAVPSPTQVRAALRRYHHEASIDAIIRAIDELPELSAETIARLVRRGRLAALLPQIRGRARRGQAVDLSERVDDLRYSTDDSLSVELALTWDLNRLVYGPDEVALSREAARRREAKVQRSRLIVGVYFERRRLQLERDLLGVVDMVHELRIQELGAMLNALSDGAFSRLSGLQPE
ncbi:MAG: hypothetical protein ACI9KE_004479 [Polyangiales bacterium]|jgi:hypothetical protein